jgi:hypothetical protein
MSEKQTTFFTVNCAEKLEFPNQCYKLCGTYWINRMDTWNIRKQIGLDNWYIISQRLATTDTIKTRIS